MVDMLFEAGMLGCKAADIPLDPNLKLFLDRELLEDLERYRRLVGKLYYLTMASPYIAYSDSVVSQFVLAPRMSH